MRLALLLTALGLLVPAAAAQRSVSAWYHIGSEAESRTVRAERVEIKPQADGYIVTADLQEWVSRAPVGATYRGTGETPAPEREACVGRASVETSDGGRTVTETAQAGCSAEPIVVVTTTTRHRDGTRTTTVTARPAR